MRTYDQAEGSVCFEQPKAELRFKHFKIKQTVNSYPDEQQTDRQKEVRQILGYQHNRQRDTGQTVNLANGQTDN